MTRAHSHPSARPRTARRAVAVQARDHGVDITCDRTPVRTRGSARGGRARSVTGAPARSTTAIGTAWTFLCTVEIVNFAMVRRHLGVVRAGRVISDIAARLSTILPGARLAMLGRTSLEFRFTGDARSDVDAALAVLRDRLVLPTAIDGAKVSVEMTLAGAAAPGADVDELRLAEVLEEATIVARQERRIVVYDFTTATADRLALTRDLDGATTRGEMCVHYQPKLHLRRRKIVGVEALIRWQHPQRGMILPGDFIPGAEEARMIGDLTLWTLDQVVSDQERLAKHGYDLEVFVNISGQLLNDAAFIAEACERVRSARGKIGFEITETSVIRDPDTAITHLREIASMGVPIAIDDYGAGLSSLAYLKQLPARELKIDKMFVMQLTSSNRDPLIVRSTIDLAHAMEMEVTAEGVETQAALALLGVMGCDMVQGFLISRPMPLDALTAFLSSDQNFTRQAHGNAFHQPASFWRSG